MSRNIGTMLLGMRTLTEMLKLPEGVMVTAIKRVAGDPVNVALVLEGPAVPAIAEGSTVPLYCPAWIRHQDGREEFQGFGAPLR